MRRAWVGRARRWTSLSGAAAFVWLLSTAGVLAQADTAPSRRQLDDLLARRRAAVAAVASQVEQLPDAPTELRTTLPGLRAALAALATAVSRADSARVSQRDTALVLQLVRVGRGLRSHLQAGGPSDPSSMSALAKRLRALDARAARLFDFARQYELTGLVADLPGAKETAAEALAAGDPDAAMRALRNYAAAFTRAVDALAAARAAVEVAP